MGLVKKWKCSISDFSGSTGRMMFKLHQITLGVPRLNKQHWFSCYKKSHLENHFSHTSSTKNFRLKYMTSLTRTRTWKWIGSLLRFQKTGSMIWIVSLETWKFDSKHNYDYRCGFNLRQVRLINVTLHYSRTPTATEAEGDHMIYLCNRSN